MLLPVRYREGYGPNSVGGDEHMELDGDCIQDPVGVDVERTGICSCPPCWVREIDEIEEVAGEAVDDVGGE